MERKQMIRGVILSLLINGGLPLIGLLAFTRSYVKCHGTDDCYTHSNA